MRSEAELNAIREITSRGGHVSIRLLDKDGKPLRNPLPVRSAPLNFGKAGKAADFVFISTAKVIGYLVGIVGLSLFSGVSIPLLLVGGLVWWGLKSTIRDIARDLITGPTAK